MVQRVHYRRHCKYNTASNVVKKVKTPGAKLVLQNVQKRAKGPRCGDCKRPLAGISVVRPHLYKNLKRRDRKVSRAYGGARCHSCVKDRIIRAFLKEEQKCVKKVVLEREQKVKSVEKASAKKPAKAEPEKPKAKTEKKKTAPKA
ncbi:60S ribosomal protein L34a, putative [Theileria equi strain WA]|uniref:60S ribosomal protein L34a, putative n=1 Tax=Theileria equi strain WA TaxID=1537102 RepID=L1LB48_THEEQ|nr:60S ribosomal protein L34a, putative [Theileria equi strain WA]EKX72667.1 60S ribosomal protein L34a, putative [Theileria equi strain WA]|eukprot:XP_004832119.1 60S ribosomal protein L34a, putative [Theileria equi strain WA]